MKIRYLGIIFLGVLFFFAQCKKEELVSPPNKSINFALQTNFNKNYHHVEDSEIINFQPLLRNVHSTLFKLDSNYKPSPFLIEKFETKGKTVVFFLKKDLKFSNGSDLTYEDVVWSIEACLSYKLNPNPIYRLIEGGEDLLSGKTEHCSGIKVLNQQCFSIEFKNKNIEFPYYFTSSNLSIVPKNWTRDQMVFSGAYKLVKEEVKENFTSVLLEKNPYYIGKKPLLDTILFNFYHSISDFEGAIKRGEPDMFLENFNFKLPASDYKYNYFKTPLAGSFLFLLNPKTGVFKDRKYRIFFRNYIHSLDYGKNENWDYESPSSHILPYGLDGYFVFKPFKKENFLKFAPEKEITVKCYYIDRGIRKRIFPYLKEKLKMHNLKLELFQENWDQLTPRMRRGNFDLTAFYFMVEIPNSYHFYESLFTTSADINPYGYELPEAQNLLSAYMKEPSSLKRMKILSRLEEIAQNESFVIPYMNSLALIGFKNFVQNVKIDPFLNIHFEDIDVEKGH